MLEILLAAITTCGPLALGLILFLSPLGLPFPSALLVLAAGAFVRQGLMDWRVALSLTLFAPVLGDCAGYAVGRSLGGWVHQRSQRWAEAWHRAEVLLRRHGVSAVYLTRFLFPVVDVPINLLAGSSSLAFDRFLICSVAGRATWIAIYGGLGYTSSNHWEAVAQAVSTYAGWLGGLAVVGLGVYALLRHKPAARVDKIEKPQTRDRM